MHHWPDRYLHPALRGDAEVLRRARLTGLLSAVLVGIGLAYAMAYALVIGYLAGARILGAGALAALVVLAGLRARPWLTAAGLAIAAATYAVIVGLMICEGGIRALATPLLALPPVIATLLLGRRWGIAWAVLGVGTLAAFGAAADAGVVFALRYPLAWESRMSVGSPVGLVLCTTLLLFAFEGMREQTQARADAATAALARLAYHDALTGLANRAAFLDRLDAALAEAHAAGDASRVAVLLLDLDGFKAVNDTMGHAAGDALLAQVGARLQSAAGARGTIARLGGDEFAVLLDDVRDDADAGTVAERVVGALGYPYELATGTAQVGASLGVARAAPLDAGAGAAASAVAALLHDADVAMYRAKSLGRGRWVRAGETPVPASAAVRRGGTLRLAT